MIIFLEGVMGSGKTYEAVAYHILPALKSGRKVITNVPLFRERIAALYGFQILNLVDVRSNYKRPDGTHYIAFDDVQDFNDDWYDDENEYGALYVIDEAQIPLPNSKSDRTHQLFIEASMQRHSGHDWILITQDTDNVYKPIVSLTQAIHYMKKRLSLGQPTHYWHYIYDGNTKGKKFIEKSVRQYDPLIFTLYKSHTRRNKSVKEYAMNAFTMTRFKMFKPFGWFFAILIIYVISILWGGSDDEDIEVQQPIVNAEVEVQEVIVDEQVDMKPQRSISVSTDSGSVKSSAPVLNTVHSEADNSKPEFPKSTKSFVKENDGLYSNDVVNVLPYQQDLYNRSVITSKNDFKRAPLDDYKIQLVGALEDKKQNKKEYIYSVYAQSGSVIEYKRSDLVKMNYAIIDIAECMQILDHPNMKEPEYITCHAPTFGESNDPVKGDSEGKSKNSMLNIFGNSK